MPHDIYPTVGSTNTTSSTSSWSSAVDRIAVVVNGNARGVTEELVDMLGQIVQSGDLFVSRNLAEGRDIARTVVERGYPTILTGGGDGTFVQMVTWIVRISESMGREPPRFGFLKLGTGNALAWVLGAQNAGARGVMADLGRLRNEGGSRILRLIEVEDLLAPFAGVGADSVALSHYQETRAMMRKSQVLKRLSSGPVAYAISILGRTAPEFLFGRTLNVRVINTGGPAYRIGPQGRPEATPLENQALLYAGPTTILAFSTIPYWGFGARVFPFADEREDRFNLRIADLGPIEAMANLKSIWRGTYQSPHIRDFLVESIMVQCDNPAPIQVGGDPVGRRTAVSASLSKRPVRVVDFYSPPDV
jgi:diacylglycerol kinase family enzyme